MSTSGNSCHNDLHYFDLGLEDNSICKRSLETVKKDGDGSLKGNYIRTDEGLKYVQRRVYRGETLRKELIG